MHPRGLCPVTNGGDCRHKGIKNCKQSPWFVEMTGKRKARFEKEEIQCLILDILKEKECHGYEIMQSIWEKTDGMYKPSPGALYPALQMLEDIEMITSSTDGRRKVYELTEKGNIEIEAKRSLVEDIYDDLVQNKNLEWEEFFVKAHEDFSTIFKSASRAFKKGEMGPEKVNKILKIIRNSVKTVKDVLEK